MANTFEGFPREVPRFWFDLKLNNTYEKQAENIGPYKALLTEPLTRLYEAMLPWVDAADAGLETRRARCVSSPYRDRRFAPPEPLREYVYLRFVYAARDTEVPGLFFGMGGDCWVVGLRFYHYTTKGVARIRDAVRAEPDTFSEALGTAADAGYLPCGNLYKTDHAPERPDGPLKLLLNSRDIELYRLFPLEGAVFGPELVGAIESGFGALLPLLRLFTGLPAQEERKKTRVQEFWL